MPASLAGTDAASLAGAAPVLGFAFELSRDGTARALEPLCNIGDHEKPAQQQ